MQYNNLGSTGEMEADLLLTKLAIDETGKLSGIYINNAKMKRLKLWCTL